MKKKLIIFMLTLISTLFFAFGAADAAALYISAIKTDTMSSYDRLPANYQDNAPIKKESGGYYPAYPKPNKYIYIQVKESDVLNVKFESNYKPEYQGTGLYGTIYRFDITSKPVLTDTMTVNGESFLVGTTAQINLYAWDTKHTQYLSYILGCIHFEI